MADQREFTAVDKVLGNTDLLIKILNLLPPKQLIISKAVSNHWLALISDPHFLLDYSRQLHASQPPSSFSQFYHGIKPFSLDGSDEFIPKIDRIQGIRRNVSTDNCLQILNSCNGLMLCYHGFGTPMLLVNPTTQKHRLIPEPYHFFDPKFNTFLAFDPSKSIYYKVVNFRYPRFEAVDHSWVMSYSPAGDSVIYIFSSESGSWKEIRLPALPDWLDISATKVFWGGAIHWINRLNLHVQFHIEQEKFTWNQMTIDPDNLPKSNDREYILAECDNGLLAMHLLAVGNYEEFDQTGVLTIFELNKDSNLWSLKHEVDLKLLLSEFPEMERFRRIPTFLQLDITVLYVKIEANEETLRLVLAIPGKMILYSVKMENNQFTATKVLKELRWYAGSHRDFHPYIQCLVPV